MSELFEKLNSIKKVEDNETRLRRLKEVCSDRDILNDALEIAKHASTITLPGMILMTALTALVIALINLVPVATNYKIGSVIIVIGLYYYVIYTTIKFEFARWNKLYYVLIDLRREEPDISKLDVIISKVGEINPKIDVLEKNVNTKLEAIEKEIISLKKK